jgi:cytochrome c1
MPGPGGPGAPELTKVGASAEHTKEWLTEKIRDPRKAKPDSKMPPFPADKLSDADLKNLVEYLASLKGEAPKKDGKEGKPDPKGGKDDKKGNP